MSEHDIRRQRVKSFYWSGGGPGGFPRWYFWGFYTRYSWGWQLGSRWTGFWVFPRYEDAPSESYWSWDGTPPDRDASRHEEPGA